MNNQSGSRNQYKYILKNFAFALLIFSFIICLLEITLRHTHLFGARISWSVPDNLLGRRSIPNSTYWHYKENDHSISGKFNNYGWRDEEWSLQKPQNTFRIALLGDSYIEALQVEDDKTFEHYTEISLNNSLDLNVELLNFGQSGFTQTEELLLLTREVIHFSPDMVILFFYPENDIDDISKGTALSTLRPFYRITGKGELLLDTSFNELFSFRIRTLVFTVKRHSALISLIAERYNSFRQQKRIRISKKNRDSSNKNIHGTLSLATASPDQLYLENYTLNKLLIKKMAKFCKNRGILFMLVAINTKTYIPAIEADYLSIDPTYNSEFFDVDLEAFAQSLDIEFLGLQRIFNAHYKELNIPLQWGHWNYEGHQTVANALTEKLEMIIPLQEQ